MIDSGRAAVAHLSPAHHRADWLLLSVTCLGGGVTDGTAAAAIKTTCKTKRRLNAIVTADTTT